MKKSKIPLLTKISYGTAVALACFSGGVATYGLTKFAPGAEMASRPWASSSRPASSRRSPSSTGRSLSL
jgi:hypothetical protein